MASVLRRFSRAGVGLEKDIRLAVVSLLRARGFTIAAQLSLAAAGVDPAVALRTQ